MLLMATGGTGAQVIINNLSGNLLQATVGCLADYGRMIQIGKFDLEENNSIGMSVFLKNTSFYVVNLENIVNAPKEVKEDIKAKVRAGIEDLSVRPITRKVVEDQNVGEILKTLRTPGHIGKIIIKIDKNLALNKFILDNPTQFICDSKSSYLVYGGSAELWTDTVEWLVLRGARKIVVCSESKPQQIHLNRRLSLLQSYYKAEIILASNKAHTREGATELVSEVYNLGPIHAVLMLPSKNTVSKISDIKPVQYIDNALRTSAPKALLVNFINNAAGLTQIRLDAGYQAYNIQWQKDLCFTDALYGLDQVLSFTPKNILIKNDKISDSNQETTQALFKSIICLLQSNNY